MLKRLRKRLKIFGKEVKRLKLVTQILAAVLLIGLVYWLVFLSDNIAQAVTITQNGEYFSNGLGDYIHDWGPTTDVVIDGAKVEINHPITVRNLTLKNGAVLSHAPSLRVGRIPLARDNFAVRWGGTLEVRCRNGNPSCPRPKLDIRELCATRERSGLVDFRITNQSGQFPSQMRTERWNVAPEAWGSKPKWMELLCYDFSGPGDYTVAIEYIHVPARSPGGNGSPAYLGLAANVKCPATRPPGPCGRFDTDPLGNSLKTPTGASGLTGAYYGFPRPNPTNPNTIDYNGFYPPSLKANRADLFNSVPYVLGALTQGQFYGYYWGQAGVYDSLGRLPDQIGIRVIDKLSIDASSRINVNFKGYPGGSGGSDLLNTAPDLLLTGRNDYPAWSAAGFSSASQSSAGQIDDLSNCRRSQHNGGGGGYGGAGGRNGPNHGRAIPDDPSATSWIGGGGDLGFCAGQAGLFGGRDDGSYGGTGGGRMSMTATTIVLESGSLSKVMAQGGQGGVVTIDGPNSSAGGGAGGGVCLSADEISFNGVNGRRQAIDVSGGDTELRRAGYGGGGGGGRIALKVSSLKINGNPASLLLPPGSSQRGVLGLWETGNPANQVELLAWGGDRPDPPTRGQDGTIYYSAKADCAGVPDLTVANLSKTVAIPVASQGSNAQTVRAIKAGQSASGSIAYTITAQINSAIGRPIIIEDTLPSGVTYASGSGTLNGASQDGALCGANQYCWSITSPPPGTPTTYTVTFSVNVRPSDYANCGDLVNHARILEDANPIATTSQTTQTECFELTKEVRPPGGSWASSLANRDPGEDLQFRLSYRTSSSTNPLPSWAILDTPQNGRYDGAYLSAPSSVQARLNGAPITYNYSAGIFNFTGLPDGQQSSGQPHQITFFMKIADDACSLAPKEADNDAALAIGSSVTPGAHIDINLLCRIRVEGDVGVGGPSTITINRFRVAGPGVFLSPQGLAATGVGKVDDQIRQLPNYGSLPVAGQGGWLEQLITTKDKLKREVAKETTALATNFRLDGSNGSNPLRVWRYDVSAGTRCLIRGIEFTNGPGTLIITGRPPNQPSCQDGGVTSLIIGDLNQGLSTSPIAIVLADDCHPANPIVGSSLRIRIDGSTNRRIGSANGPVALIAPCSVVNIGTEARNISFNGLIMAGRLDNLDHPNPSGLIRYNQKFVENPPPGMAKLLTGVGVDEKAP